VVIGIPTLESQYFHIVLVFPRVDFGAKKTKGQESLALLMLWTGKGKVDTAKDVYLGSVSQSIDEHRLCHGSSHNWKY
jgi:hypothetical protein